MDFILPTTITDAILISSNVPETDYGEWSGTFSLAALSETARYWSAMCAAPGGNIYASVYPGDIYMQTAGSGAFNALGGTSRQWTAMCAAPGGNIYACVNAGDIYMQTAGSGAFNALSETSRNWRGMCAAPNGNIYAAVYGGDIYMQTAGSGAFNALSETSRDWSAMCAAPNGNIYACVNNSDIYIQTAGSGSFAALSQTSRAWMSMCADANGNIYACVDSGDIYVRWKGAGNFVALSQSTRNWRGMCISPSEVLYACVYSASGDIYTDSVDIFYEDGDYVIKASEHKIYESLTNANYNHDPASDATNWLEVGATNLWKCLDGTIGNQTSQATSIQYVLTPGACDSLALLNLDATSVQVAVTPANLIGEDDSPLEQEQSTDNLLAESYDYTVDVTGKTDLVITDLVCGATDVLTITITKTGTVKVGELIVGNKTFIGDMQYSPSIGIKDWSTKEVDVYGHYTITPRTYSKWMKVSLVVLMAALDQLALNLATYRSTPLVWVGSETYSSLIIYGYYTDFSIVLPYPAYAICQLEIEGLT